MNIKALSDILVEEEQKLAELRSEGTSDALIENLQQEYRDIDAALQAHLRQKEQHQSNKGKLRADLDKLSSRDDRYQNERNQMRVSLATLQNEYCESIENSRGYGLIEADSQISDHELG